MYAASLADAVIVVGLLEINYTVCVLQLFNKNLPTLYGVRIGTKTRRQNLKTLNTSIGILPIESLCLKNGFSGSADLVASV